MGTSKIINKDNILTAVVTVILFGIGMRIILPNIVASVANVWLWIGLGLLMMDEEIPTFISKAKNNSKEFLFRSCLYAFLWPKFVKKILLEK
jgi:hypothetical protein